MKYFTVVCPVIMNLKKYLYEITESQFGANSSAKPSGEIPCVQGRDFNSDGIYIATEPQFVPETALKYTRSLEENDVLFSTKGKFYAAIWHNQIPNAIATGTFIVLKVTDDSILPEYLAIYLNSSRAKKYYEQNIKAATVVHIGKKQLDYLEVEIPPLQKQRSLVKAYQLLIEEKTLVKELIKRKEKLLNTLL